jgi:hypothetical protein
MMTFTPLGVASEYSCSGCLPRGSSFSWVGPAMGGLMLAKALPLPLPQVQTCQSFCWPLLLVEQCAPAGLGGWLLADLLLFRNRSVL